MMRRSTIIAFTAAAFALAVYGAAPAEAQRPRDRATGTASRGGDSTPRGQATARRNGDSGSRRAAAPAPAPSTSSESSGSAGGNAGNEARATQPGSNNSTTGRSRDSRGRAGAPSSDSDRDGSGRDAGAAGRPRNDREVRGQAVERRPGSRGGDTTVIVTRGRNGGGYYGGGYYPWGYGGLGLGGYYGGLYDPWWYDESPYAGQYGYGDEGSLRLKIKPRDASVYVDGYFAGRVDDYDGVFQRLTIEPGPHRIEVRADGFESLMFEVRIQPDRTITYTADLKPIP